MAETLYATFHDPNRAHTAARDLVEQGVKCEEMSLLIKHDGHVEHRAGGVDLEDTRSTSPMREQWGNTLDPTSNDIRQSSVARIERGVESDPLRRSPGDDLEHSRGFNAISETSPANLQVDPDAESYRDADPRMKDEASGGDMARGVATGAGIGLGVGAAAALATLLVPGIGLVIGSGAIAVAAGALAASTATGAIAGGIAGLLKEQGVPDDQATRYDQVYGDGGAVLAVTVLRPAERSAIEATLARNGAAEVEAHQAYMA